MSLYATRALRGVFGAAVVCLAVATAGAQTATSRIVSNANTFLATLDQKQRQTVVFAFNDEKQRARWSNFPVAMSPRGGISLKDMTPAQRAAAMALLSSALSPRGFEKVEQIMEGDEINKVQEAKNGNRPPRGNGGPPRANGGPPPGMNRAPFTGDLFGKDLYYFSILGTPSEKDPWMLQFGGHHLALNITIAGERGILTPTLTGAQPSSYTSGGETVRPLGKESDKGMALLNALNEGQRKQAILSYQLADLVLGPGQDGVTLQPEGIKASAMNESQRAMLLDVISEWAGIMHESAAAIRLAQLKADLNETWFAWSGPTTVTPGNNIAAYYRIQGPHLVIEYAPQGRGEQSAMHVHTMYRDPTNDYGRGPIKK
jgi:Protein of unknown function (DUF3500)